MWQLHSMFEMVFAHPVESNMRVEEQAAAQSWLYFVRATEGEDTV